MTMSFRPLNYTNFASLYRFFVRGIIGLEQYKNRKEMEKWQKK